MHTYLALLRGVNVGGNGIIKMEALRQALTAAGLHEVRTYIQSGNVIFASEEKDTDGLAAIIANTITSTFSLTVGVAVFTKEEWHSTIQAAPQWWGNNTEWKHNLLVLLKPFNMEDAIASIGPLKPDIEAMLPGKGVLYQSVSIKFFGHTTTGKLASTPIYKKMTIRNYNTATKLLTLLD